MYANDMAFRNSAPALAVVLIPAIMRQRGYGSQQHAPVRTAKRQQLPRRPLSGTSPLQFENNVVSGDLTCGFLYCSRVYFFAAVEGAAYVL